jgi:hypothetical protein
MSAAVASVQGSECGGVMCASTCAVTLCPCARAGREREPPRPRDASGLSFDVGSAVAMAGEAARQGQDKGRAAQNGAAQNGDAGGANGSRDDGE